MKKLYKIISPDFMPIHGGSGKWFAPTKGKPAKWMPKVDRVRICSSGYHLIDAEAIVDWLPCGQIISCLYEAEGRGDRKSDGHKMAFAQARLLKVIGHLDEKSMRLAAADMAERVLPIFYKVRPKDNRPAKAIQAARDVANGKIDDASREAAWAAAWTAAADAAAGGNPAADAAWAAARAAAGAAAGTVPGDTVVDAARGAALAAARGASMAAAKGAAGTITEIANAEIIIARAKARLIERNHA